MARLSMGGMQTFQITLSHLDLFSQIGGFSGASGMLVLGDRKLDPKTDYNGVFADPAAFARKVHLLWLSVGTVEPERMRAGLERLHASLDEAKIQHVFYESPGTDHEWQTWRRDLKDFAHYMASSRPFTVRSLNQSKRLLIVATGGFRLALKLKNKNSHRCPM